MTQNEIESPTQLQQQQMQDPIDLSKIDAEINVICDRLWQLAQLQQKRPQGLLRILRDLETLHRQIRDDLFQPALPTSRHELFNLLRDIEGNGGWPHIYRMKINEICQYLEQIEDNSET
ncbi:MAG: hypothetical protein NW214_08305 [Pseudanabaenaceae cyanobacterium bins.39]|nr:hypothetical protein [Pseudanabaenaceae cyanobacterium bins.39]